MLTPSGLLEVFVAKSNGVTVARRPRAAKLGWFPRTSTFFQCPAIVGDALPHRLEYAHMITLSSTLADEGGADLLVGHVEM